MTPKKGRHRETVKRALALAEALEDGWCYTTGYVQHIAERVWGRASSTEVDTALEILVERGVMRRVETNHPVLFCKGDDVEGVRLLYDGREAAVTAAAVRKLLEEIVAGLKSHVFHMPSRSVTEKLGLKPSSTLNAAVAFLMSMVDGKHFAGLETRGSRDKAYFVFRK